MEHRTIVIGLTGGIGSGKSTVLDMFREKGCAVFVADDEAKALMHNDAVLVADIKSLLGQDVYVNGVLQRKQVAARVFGNADLLQALNALVHPRVRERFREVLEQCHSEFLIYEAAILFESNADALCDRVIAVYTPEPVRLERICERDGSTPEEVVQRMRHQADDSEKLKKADFVIRNDRLASTMEQVGTIYDLLLKLREYY